MGNPNEMKDGSFWHVAWNLFFGIDLLKILISPLDNYWNFQILKLLVCTVYVVVICVNGFATSHCFSSCFRCCIVVFRLAIGHFLIPFKPCLNLFRIICWFITSKPHIFVLLHTDINLTNNGKRLISYISPEGQTLTVVFYCKLV